VITFDNRGVGASSGRTPNTIEAMARDAMAFIGALGFEKVDLFGFSVGGVFFQIKVQQEPQLVRKLVLAGTGPARGEGIVRVTATTLLDMAHGAVTFKDPKTYLFFTGTANGRASAKSYLARLRERTDDRDKSVSISSFRAQLKAIHRWGKQGPDDLSRIDHPVLMMNGDHDRMVPTVNTIDMARRFPNAELTVYPDAGHGGVFQYHEDFVNRALDFLER